MRCAELALAAGLAIAALPAVAEQTLVHTERSLYRNILVYRDDDLQCMKFTRLESAGRQTCQLATDPARLVFDYTRMMMGALYLEPAPRRILVIGLGGGSLPTALAGVLPGARIDVVEVDPAVVRVAERFFGFRAGPAMRVQEDDGRVFVKRALRGQERYDLVMLDAFDHEYIPEHLLTREFLAEVKELVAEHGVLAANTFSTSRLYDHESTTYEAVFGLFYNLQQSNRVILWRRGGLPPPEVLERNAAALDPKLRGLGVEREWLLPLFSTERTWRADARVLTDQYSPSNLLNGR
jgi:spermidine synthase